MIIDIAAEIPWLIDLKVEQNMSIQVYNLGRTHHAKCWQSAHKLKKYLLACE